MASPVVNPPTPYTTLIPGGFFPGKMIRIQGFVPMHGSRFDINLQTGGGGEIAGEDVALHASVRLREGYIARNSFQGGCWQEELGEGGLPIQLGQRFEILLLSEAYEYKIAVNGQHFCGFPLRVPYNRITHLLIEGDVQVELISWEGSGASAPPMNGPPQYGAPVPPPQYTPQQTFVQQAPPPPPGAGTMPPLPGSGLYPNLLPSVPHGIPQPAPAEYPHPTHSPFPRSDSIDDDSYCTTTVDVFPASSTDYISEKVMKKIAKAEYKAEKKIYKAERKAEKKAAKAERKAIKKYGLPAAAIIGGGIGTATLVYTSSCSCSSSSCSCSD